MQVAGLDVSPPVETFRDEHRLVLACMASHFLVCGLVAMETDTWQLWFAVGMPALVFPAWLVFEFPAAILSRFAVSAGSMAFTLLGVQQTSGYMEAHFSFFVMITVIAVYRDWRLLIFASVLVIIHHIGFTIIDPKAVGFYVRNDGFGAWRHVFSHLSVGLMQVFALCYLTILLRRREKLNVALGSSLDLAKERANRDQLTGLFNRNHLEEVVARLSPRVQDGNFTAVICLLDIDHFKSVNDRYGHAAGDEVLRAVAGTIQGQLRSGDLVVRHGGEEFLAVLPDSTIEDGGHFAERIRSHVASQLITVATSPLAVTISVGLAAWRRGESFDELFRRADEALYSAKKNGRNRVEIGSDAASWQRDTMAPPASLEPRRVCG